MAGTIQYTMLAIIALQFTGKIALSEVAEVHQGSPPCHAKGEMLCWCSDDGDGNVISDEIPPRDTYDRFIFYCSEGHVCQPDKNGCPKISNRTGIGKFTNSSITFEKY